MREARQALRQITCSTTGRAGAWLDVAGVLYSWLEVVHGDDAAAPRVVANNIDTIEDVRQEWITANSVRAGLAEVKRRLQAMYRATRFVAS